MATPLMEAAKSGNRRDLLVAMKLKLVQVMEDSDSARDIPPIAKRIMEIDAELEKLPDPSRRAKSKLRQAQDG